VETTKAISNAMVLLVLLMETVLQTHVSMDFAVNAITHKTQMLTVMDKHVLLILIACQQLVWVDSAFSVPLH
jgi:hypothetical protein